MKSIIVTTLLVFSAFQFSYGQDLVYRPKNPAFGGDTFNYQWLLSSAEAQNTFTDENDPNADDRSELERFTESLNNQLLSQISRTLFNEQFGQEGLTEGTFSFGTLFIEIFPSGEGLVINILDTSTGDQSQVIIPN
ncbi:curli assembly protein CsgF [Aquimarina sp. MMG015]|uniref:curli production assembly/transport component CsgF n=1 Tax=Aquimarina TaxID=290174 RepID=UPI00041A54EE|nr:MULTISPECIES: curli production assembly/transport component CsgF [Aquimarina]AXT56321.1 curli assembly protein CsgF [Aquimarina sp. AD1]MBQ4803574.1 curli assembly protein CsgF [Aquimarina sp. MMG015]RKN18273.1 curli assembly protein CsgF [Aquimarina sp. AD1]